MRRPAPRIALANYVREEAEMYEQALTFSGFRVEPVVTCDPQIAADAIVLADPDAVLTRILPGLFGLELIRLLRRAGVMPTLPIVVLTSVAQPSLHDLAREAGANDVLLLPKTPEQVATVLRHLIDDESRRRRNA